MVSPTGEKAHYPVYAQLVGAEFDENTELVTAINILERWVRAQQHRKETVREHPIGQSPEN